MFVEFYRENAQVECGNAAEDKMYSISVPVNLKAPLDDGGLAVNLRGNVQFANGMCYFSGFFTTSSSTAFTKAGSKRISGHCPSKRS